MTTTNQRDEEVIARLLLRREQMLDELRAVLKRYTAQTGMIVDGISWYVAMASNARAEVTDVEYFSFSVSETTANPKKEGNA